MPQKLVDCVNKVKKSKAAKSDKVHPWAVCISSTGLKPEKKAKKHDS